MAASKALRAAATVLWWVTALPAGADSEAPAQSDFLYVIPVRVAPGVDLERPLLVALHGEDPAALARELGGAVVREQDSERVVADLSVEPTPPEADPKLYREATFLVDYDEPSVTALSAQAVESLGPAPGTAELVAFVRETIEPGTDRSFDIASEVARYRKGDCTEHAVLFAALARHFGHPVRIVVGTLLVDPDEDVALQAYGHAWTEVHDGERWRRTDPTPFEGGRAIAYLPESRISNEGPGFALDIMTHVSRSTTLVDVLGNADAADPVPARSTP